jgi:hypothetical protein
MMVLNREDYKVDSEDNYMEVEDPYERLTASTLELDQEHIDYLAAYEDQTVEVLS